VERELKDFVELCRTSTVEDFVKKNPNPFLYREVEVELEDEPKESDEARVAMKSKKIEQLLGQDAGYVLSLVGARKAKDVAENKLSEGRRTAIEFRVLPVVAKGPFAPGTAALIGSRQGCDVVLPETVDPYLSAKHASLEMAQDLDEWLLRDHTSDWGTFLNGERIMPDDPTVLREGSLVRFGPRLEFRFFSPAGFYRYVQFRIRLQAAAPR